MQVFLQRPSVTCYRTARVDWLLLKRKEAEGSKSRGKWQPGVAGFKTRTEFLVAGQRDWHSSSAGCTASPHTWTVSDRGNNREIHLDFEDNTQRA